MKKLSFKKYIKLYFSIISLLAVMLSGCKTLPESFTVKPLDLLDAENEFLISIPSQADPEFINYFLINNVNNFNEKDLHQINDRISHIYCGIIHEKNNFTIQTAIEENIPSKYITKQLSKNKSISNFSYETVYENDYKIFSVEGMDITFPNNTLALAGRNVTQMLDNYDYISSTGIILPNPLWENDLMYEYLLTASDEIRFYAVKPQAFLSMLVGTQMDLKLLAVYGSFKIDSEYPSQYIVELNLKFKNEKYLKAGKSLLNLAFSLTGGKVESTKNCELKISDIKIKKSQLYDLLVL